MQRLATAPTVSIIKICILLCFFFFSVSEEFSVSGEDNQAVIAGLKKYSEYSFFLTSSTVVGEGPKANLSVLTDEDGES